MALDFQQFDPWKEQSVTCTKCGQTGKLGDLPLEIRSECLEIECPECGTILASVWYSDYDVVEAAAGAGNEEAAQHLIGMREKIDYHKTFDEVKLASIDQLPDISGAAIRFSWDMSTENGHPVVTIRAGDVVIWKEPGFYECWRRFLEVKKILKAKYGKQFRELRPLKGNEYSLHGDDPRSFGRVKFY